MPRSRLEQLDSNFQTKSAGDGLQWLDAFDPRLSLRGLAWPTENRKRRNFRRLPDRAAAGLSEGVQVLSHCPAGVFVSFFTDASAISVRMTQGDLEPMDHMPATGMSGAELYLRVGPTWHPMAVARPALDQITFTRALVEDAPKERREYRLYLPLYKKLDALELGFSPRAVVEPSPASPGAKPVFFYGTSITQGGCANTAGSDFVSLTGRLLDAEVINFGFSGSGRGEPEVARLIREVKAEIFVLDFIANAELATLPKVLPEFIRILREKHPRTPIVLISCPDFDPLLWNPKYRDEQDAKRDVVMRVYVQGKEQGDRHLHYIDGPGLLPSGLTGAYVDGTHPTSHGFAIMAERLAPQLRVIRGRV